MIVGTRITSPDDAWDYPGINGHIRVTPKPLTGLVADDVTYSVQPLMLPVVMGRLLDPNHDPAVDLATAVDGEPVVWRAEPSLAYRGRDLGLERFDFTAADADEHGVIWLSMLPPPPAAALVSA